MNLELLKMIANGTKLTENSNKIETQTDRN